MNKVVKVAWDIIAVAVVVQIGIIVGAPLINGVWSRQQIMAFKKQCKETLPEGEWAHLVNKDGDIIRSFTKINGKIYRRIKPD